MNALLVLIVAPAAVILWLLCWLVCISVISVIKEIFRL